MDSAGLLAILQTRRSIRRYADQPVPDAVLRRLLEAARWAPSAHNRQPWRLAVLVDPQHKSALAFAMGERFREDLLADGMSAAQVEQQVARSIARISGAPAVIMLFVSMVDMDEYPDTHRRAAERTMAVQSVALAAQNVLLMAHAEDLGACWMCAPLFCPDVVRSALGLPANWEPQGLITLGYPAEERTKDREPIETKTRWY